MKSTIINFGGKLYDEQIAKLQAQWHIDFETGEEIFEEPWTDDDSFETWLNTKPFCNNLIIMLLSKVPRISLGLNHGPLFGVKDFIYYNNEHQNILEAGFIIVGSGPNGDYVVVNVENGKTGWLPMAMIYDMNSEQLNKHFVATNSSLGEFIHDSENKWETVPKDWYDAEEKSSDINIYDKK